tara:strand:- start:3485 stop:4198 length:714 start_codon:yes stop_codon:yes gene_type:complete
MTERENHLMFCKFCTNSSKSLNLGIICSLTEKQPEFKKSCDSYNENIKLLNSEKKSLENQIDEKYDNVRDIISFVLEKGLNIYFFDNIFKSKYDFKRKEQTHNLTINKTSEHIKILVIVFSIFTLISTINLIMNYEKFWMIFSIINISILVIIFLVLKYRKPKVLMKTDSEGFSYLKTKVKWNEILVYQSVTTEDTYSFKKVALGTKSRGIIEISISDLDIGIKDFFKIIELNKNVA